MQTPDKSFIILMALMMSIVAISIDAALPALDYIGADFNLSHPNHSQYVIGFIFIGLGIGELIAGPLSDATGRKKAIYAGVALYTIGSLICFMAEQFSVLLFGRLLQGAGVAGPYVSVVSIVRDKYSGREMAKIMSFIMTIFITVPAIAPGLGQGILFLASWRYIFLFYILYALTITCWSYIYLEETLKPENRIPFTAGNFISGLKEVSGNRLTVVYTACMSICFGSFFGYLNTSQQIFQAQFGAGKLFALYFGILALILGSASLMNSQYVEKYGMKYICKRGFFCIVTASAVFLLMHFLTDITLWMFILYAAVLFFCFGLIFGNLNALAMEPMGHIAGIASAIIGCVSSLISMVIGAFIGQLSNNNLIPIVSGFLILGALALLLLFYAESIQVKSSKTA